MKKENSNIQTTVYDAYHSILRQVVALIEDVRISINKHVYGCLLCSNAKVLRIVALLSLPYNVNLHDRTIGVADYQLILPKEELQRVLTDEISAYDEENKK